MPPLTPPPTPSTRVHAHDIKVENNREVGWTLVTLYQEPFWTQVSCDIKTKGLHRLMHGEARFQAVYLFISFGASQEVSFLTSTKVRSSLNKEL